MRRRSRAKDRWRRENPKHTVHLPTCMHDEPGVTQCTCAFEAEAEQRGVTVYFNPFLFTDEQNNEFIARGWEPMPMRVPT